MLAVILFVICMAASAIGSLVGAGGGVIIKPVIDMLGLMSVEAASFCSGCTVLCMSFVSLAITRKSGVKLELKISTPLAVGAVIGGFVGKALLEIVSVRHGSQVLGGVQAVALTLITAGVLLYVINKNRLRSLHIENILPCALIGLLLGVISSFLGIGGGTSNVAILFFFFSMNAHTAARNSIYIIVFSQLASIIAALFTGRVPDISGLNLVCMAAGGMLGAVIGNVFSRRLKDSGVETALKALLTIMLCIDLYNTAVFLL